ncbi:neutral/alkaline non-lysosomal ceramidase N-terminal domain-containing protein [Flavihumibacter profundi]|uniref:neutral/alkaline non-lysosomal ceramidase N-terminal domain-containing protein n=1 Tax=Flavihumibacter profundi TaxID=2716883 RepID=UPI001CC62071|nr:neutral/alkaline non-lysosomal ceramidase N-terminal domain-containing protein [Flavihumibacter profundi]MBZ5857301.1 neutral/alkaline non-lysosomal ceramidase N-terminal domain-containing protein [Flavihumibacter profundi]
MKNCFLVIGALCFFVFHADAHNSQLKASVASVDITPPIEMKYTLGGYGERMNKPAEAIHDRIWAKALVLEKDNRKYAIITLDLLGLPANVKQDLLKRISSLGWNADNMMLLPSHSHGSLEMSALNSKNLLGSPQIGIFQPELLDFLLNKLEALVIAADQNYQPVKIGTASKTIDGLNRNRRKDPEVDKEMIVTRVDLENGKPLAVLVNWTAHPTFIGGKDMLVSAEWPGYLQTELQNRIGNGVTVMYYNGSEGDQSPILNEPGDAYKNIEVYGQKIAGIAFEEFKGIKTKNNKAFDYSYRVIKLPARVAHPSFMKTGGSEYGLNEGTVKVILEMMCPTEVGIGAVRIGDLIIAGVPGEMTAVLGMKIKSSLEKGSADKVAIGGLANEWISYILSRNQYEHGEGYESSVSFYGAGLGDLISDEVIKTALPITGTK